MWLWNIFGLWGSVLLVGWLSLVFTQITNIAFVFLHLNHLYLLYKFVKVSNYFKNISNLKFTTILIPSQAHTISRFRKFTFPKTVPRLKVNNRPPPTNYSKNNLHCCFTPCAPLPQVKTNKQITIQRAFWTGNPLNLKRVSFPQKNKSDLNQVEKTPFL